MVALQCETRVLTEESYAAGRVLVGLALAVSPRLRDGGLCSLNFLYQEGARKSQGFACDG